MGTTETARVDGTGLSPRVRRWLLVLSGAALALATVIIVWLFWSNTESLTIKAEADPMSPGKAATIIVGIGDAGCGPSFEHLYRRTLVGRWRLTHTSDDARHWARHDRGLLSLGSWEDVSPLPCGTQGGADLVIPTDVTWSPVVACSHDDDNCVRIDVDHEQ